MSFLHGWRSGVFKGTLLMKPRTCRTVKWDHAQAHMVLLWRGRISYTRGTPVLFFEGEHSPTRFEGGHSNGVYGGDTVEPRHGTVWFEFCFLGGNYLSFTSVSRSTPDMATVHCSASRDTAGWRRCRALPRRGIDSLPLKWRGGHIWSATGPGLLIWPPVGA